MSCLLLLGPQRGVLVSLPSSVPVSISSSVSSVGWFRCQHSATVTAAPALACLHLPKVRPALCGANGIVGLFDGVHVDRHGTPE